MQKRFGVKIGLSDHTMGSIVPIVATSLGASVVEKHYILNRKAGGPDSSFSMEPSEFKEMVDKIRDVEKSLGKVNYKVLKKNKYRRRSLFVVKDIKKGEEFTCDYGFGYDEDYKQFPCKCQAKNCCGYIVRAESRWRINKKFSMANKKKLINNSR